MYSEDHVIDIMLDFAERDGNIRAVLMEGSRAYGMVDSFSDYDLVYVTESSEPYFNGAILPFLIEKFGDIAVMQTPDNGDPHDVYTHLIQFASGIRIDLTFNSLSFLARASLESATLVLMDKDGRFQNLPAANDSDFHLSKPVQADFDDHVNEFWWCCPYVAKALARGQILHALEILGDRVRGEYAWMLCCLAGTRNNWNRVNTGKHLTNIVNLVAVGDLHYCDALLQSYTRADLKEIYAALQLLMEKYEFLSAIVAGALNYAFDENEAKKTKIFIGEHFKLDKLLAQSSEKFGEQL